MIQIENITLGYGKKVLMRDISASASTGGLTMIAGRNGSGKSTLIRALTGLSRPLSGRILADGENIAVMPREKSRAESIIRRN